MSRRIGTEQGEEVLPVKNIKTMEDESDANLKAVINLAKFVLLLLYSGEGNRPGHKTRYGVMDVVCLWLGTSGERRKKEIDRKVGLIALEGPQFI